MNPPLPSTGNSCQSTWDYPQTFQSMKEHCPAHSSAQAPQAPLNKLLRDLEVCPWGCTWVWVYCPVSPISPSTYAHWSMHSCLPHMLLFIQSCSPLKLTASSSDQSLAQCHLFQEALSPSHTHSSSGPSLPLVTAQLFPHIPPEIGTHGREGLLDSPPVSPAQLGKQLAFQAQMG